jgi:hypothetical protein
MSKSETTPEVPVGDAHQAGRRPFVEPEVSSPVDVVNGNPAADAFFAVIASGVTP